MFVLRQKRIFPSSAGTIMLMPAIWPGTELTVKIVPVSAFSGRPPSAGGRPSSVGVTLKRGSRHEPVHTFGSSGSIRRPGCDSL